MRITKAERDEAITTLLAPCGAPTYGRGIKPGSTVYTILRHVSSSGMTRVIDAFVICPNSNGNPEPWRIGSLISKVLCRQYDDKREGVIVKGCGMNMGFELIYSLGRALFPQGFGNVGEVPGGVKMRPTTPEMAARAVRAGYVFHDRKSDDTGWDHDGGYALRQTWI